MLRRRSFIQFIIYASDRSKRSDASMLYFLCWLQVIVFLSEIPVAALLLFSVSANQFSHNDFVKLQNGDRCVSVLPLPNESHLCDRTGIRCKYILLPHRIDLFLPKPGTI